MARKLRELGVEAFTAYNADEFWALLEKKASQIDACSLDIDLGHNLAEDGLRVLSQVVRWEEQHRRRLFKAIVTSHPEHEDTAYELGADVFIVKGAVQSDVLELLMQSYKSTQTVAEARGTSLKAQRLERESAEIAEHAESLLKRWSAVKWRAIGRSVDRALAWPFLSDSETAMLAALSELVGQHDDENGPPGAEVVRLIEATAEALRHGVDEDAFRSWANRADAARMQTLRPWFRGLG